MEYSDVIKERFSVRSFKKDPIEKEKLDRILEAGRIAPTYCQEFSASEVLCAEY